MFFECRCAVCDSAPGPVCDACAAGLAPGPRNDVVRAAFVLDDAARAIVVALKYRRERRLARWVASTLAPLVPALVDTVTWVPATPERVKWRGYDQSGEIAGELARLLGVPAQRLLTRQRGDHRQTSRNRLERAAGPQLGICRPADGLVVVVDDVVTTGATIAKAQAVLSRSGANRAIPVVFAATPRWDQGPMHAAEHSSTIRSWKSKSAPSAPKSLLVSRNM